VSTPTNQEPDILNRPLGEGFDLKDLLNNIKNHYLQRAMAEAGGNKTEAAKLVGLRSYQTFDNWTKRQLGRNRKLHR
jgi:transcriptional regulator with PAS, ATPase and Fis domain